MQDNNNTFSRTDDLDEIRALISEDPSASDTDELSLDEILSETERVSGR